MKNPFSQAEPEAFFWREAGFSYKPPETEQEGRARTARELASAEREACRVGAQYVWEPSEIDSSSFSEDPEPWQLWDCALLIDGESVASVGAVDFGRDKTPWGKPYARVVQAELAAEWISRK